MQQDVVSNMRLHKVLTIPRTKEQVLLNRPEKRFSVMTTEIDAAARHFYDRMMRHISEHTQSNIAADLIIQQQYVDTAAPVDKFLSSAQTILSSESEGFNSESAATIGQTIVVILLPSFRLCEISIRQFNLKDGSCKPSRAHSSTNCLTICRFCQKAEEAKYPQISRE